MTLTHEQEARMRGLTSDDEIEVHDIHILIFELDRLRDAECERDAAIARGECERKMVKAEVEKAEEIKE